jgi:hypothetical protein
LCSSSGSILHAGDERSDELSEAISAYERERLGTTTTTTTTPPASPN